VEVPVVATSEFCSSLLQATDPTPASNAHIATVAAPRPTNAPVRATRHTPVTVASQPAGRRPNGCRGDRPASASPYSHDASASPTTSTPRSPRPQYELDPTMIEIDAGASDADAGVVRTAAGPR
jgi:hypothetical protein